jgi:hypothetical protein
VKISFAPLLPDAVAYLGRKVGVDFSYGSFMPPNWFCVTARTGDGALAGVLACEFRTPFDVTFNAAIGDRRCLSRRLLKAIFRALFSKAVRVTAEIASTNKDAIRMMERLGFVYEGYCRRGINGVQDALVFGMLEEDCKFLPGYAGGTTMVMEKPHGWPAEAS